MKIKIVYQSSGLIMIFVNYFYNNNKFLYNNKLICLYFYNKLLQNYTIMKHLTPVTIINSLKAFIHVCVYILL